MRYKGGSSPGSIEVYIPFFLISIQVLLKSYRSQAQASGNVSSLFSAIGAFVFHILPTQMSVFTWHLQTLPAWKRIGEWTLTRSKSSKFALGGKERNAPCKPDPHIPGRHGLADLQWCPTLLPHAISSLAARPHVVDHQESRSIVGDTSMQPRR